MDADLEEKLDPPHFSLRYEKETRDGVLLFHCQGGFSLQNHALLDRMLQEIKASPERKVVLNLGAIRYIDSVGIGTLAAIIKHTMTSRVDCVLISNEIVDKVLAASSMDRVIRIARSVEEAKAMAASSS